MTPPLNTFLCTFFSLVFSLFALNKNASASFWKQSVSPFVSFKSDPPKSKKLRYSWEADKPLRWSDFKGRPDPTTIYSASSNTGISHTFSMDHRGYLVKKSSQVRAYFYPLLSWYIPKRINETTLSHEQTHFNISELHARLLRKAIAEFRFTANSKQEIHAIYKKIERARKAMQDQFDRETQHSIDRAQEQAWENQIAHMLYTYRHWSFKP